MLPRGECLRCTAGALVVLFAALGARADEVDVRHGAAPHLPFAGPRFEGGLALTYQHARDTRVKDSGQASLDVVLDMQALGGDWTLYLEGATTPPGQGASRVLAEANADAGTALDAHGRGRVQVSELYYSRTVGGGWFSAGVLDATSYLDASAVANNETTQFIGRTLVNNPTIEFPDYSPGLVYHREPGRRVPGLSLMASASAGLGDNPRATYAELFDIDDDRKGMFAAAEFYWQGAESTVRLGAWTHTGDHARLDGEGVVDRNLGAYLSVDRNLGRGGVNLRLGAADPTVSRAARFVSLAYARPVGRVTVGAGVARTEVSAVGRAPGQEDVTQAELYARFPPTGGLSMSPSVQWLHNSGFDGSGLRLSLIHIRRCRRTYPCGAMWLPDHLNHE